MNEFLLVPKFEASDNKKYKVKTIQDIVIYAKKVGKYVLGLYYLIV